MSFLPQSLSEGALCPSVAVQAVGWGLGVKIYCLYTTNLFSTYQSSFAHKMYVVGVYFLHNGFSIHENYLMRNYTSGYLSIEDLSSLFCYPAVLLNHLFWRTNWNNVETLNQTQQPYKVTLNYWNIKMPHNSFISPILFQLPNKVSVLLSFGDQRFTVFWTW